MALLKLNQDDINKSTPPSAGWHLFEITKYEDKKREAPKEGFEYIFDLKVVRSQEQGEAEKGRTSQVRFYSTAMGFMVPFVSAVLQTPVTKELEFDPEKFVGKQILGEMVDSTYQGKAQKRVENFAPATDVPF